MIRTLVKKLVLYDDKLEIYYNFSPEKLPDYPDDMDNRDFLYIDSSIFTSPCAPSTASPCFLFCCDCVEGWKFELRGIDNIITTLFEINIYRQITHAHFCRAVRPTRELCAQSFNFVLTNNT